MFATWVLIASILAPIATQEAPQGAAASEDEIRVATDHANSVIAANDAGEYFINATTTDVPTVRHLPSGMVCRFFGMDQRDVIRFYPGEAHGAAPGEDVSCGTWIGSTYLTLYATRYPTEHSLEDLFQSAAGEIARAWPSGRNYEGPFAVPVLEGQADPMGGAITAERDDRTVTSVLFVQKIGDWAFKARATGEEDGETVIEYSGMAFAWALPTTDLPAKTD
ncbi:MAG: hypothetical protein KF910_08875 [Brevundimonas sp.]|uniref:hypothetical protein n=1 Tax=Brevundimonas sp. TaxID=1871086 RepID=UPI0025C2CA26|nr:hypothetical protein [Brevundimonas sp.]MBX3477708.1 hypothetical protein [Brevundimonas sp.]